MRCSVRLALVWALLGWMMFAPSATAQSIPSAYDGVFEALGKKGDYRDGVLRVALPRNDLEVTIKGAAMPTSFGATGFVAFAQGDGGMHVMMGDLVVTEDEVNPVMSAVLDNGLDVSALHNHFFWESPRLFFMHIHGHGKPGEIAAKLRPALNLLDRPVRSTSSVATAAGTPATTLDTAVLSRIVGHPGEQLGSVYKITIGRPDLKLTEMGAVINARMGMNTWATFAGSNDHAMMGGDVAMLESEVTSVLEVLRKNGLNVVAIHHHMTTTKPVVIFLHYWGHGPAEQLARGLRAAIDVLAKARPASTTP